MPRRPRAPLPPLFEADSFPADLEPRLHSDLLSPGRSISSPIALRRELSPARLARIAQELRARAASLRQLPARHILDALARVHAQWAEPESHARRTRIELLAPLTGYPAAMLDRSLRELFAAMDAEAMEGWLRAAAIPLEAIDGFVPGGTSGPDCVAVYGPELTVVVSSGNIPGAALPSVVQALLLKSPCLVKTSSSEPLLPVAYARSLVAEAPEVAAALVVTGWEGGEELKEEWLLQEADALIAYGGDAAMTALRSRLPAHARFIGYGHRISFAALGREMLAEATVRPAAAALADDLSTFDQQGCLSPQAVFVERGGAVSPAAFGALLAEALEARERSEPRRALKPEESAAIHQYRAAVEMRALGEEGLRLWSSPEGTRWTVVLENRPELEPCVLNRTAILRPVADVSELPGHVAAHRPHLISASVAVSPERLPALAQSLGAAGVKRIAPLGQAQHPRTLLHHDGVNALAHLARFMTVEESL